jgi:hypothetical protein
MKLNLHCRIEVAAVAVLLLGSCGKTTDEMVRDNLTTDNPIGRYQAVPSSEGRVWVIDTRYGVARLCAPGERSDYCGEWIK